MTKHFASLLKRAGFFAVMVVLPNLAAVGEERLPWQTEPYASNAYAARGSDDTYRPGVTYGEEQRGQDQYANRYDQNRDVYVAPPDDVPSGNVYRPADAYQGDTYRPGPESGSPPSSDFGYGEPYTPAPNDYDTATPPPKPYRDPYQRGYDDRREYGAPPPSPPRAAKKDYYEQNEIISAGHGFFGSVSQGLAQAIEYAFRSQGRPNGYILGEDAGGAFVIGLRYGEGRLHTKDAGRHAVYWQGPSVGYDAGAEGSKTMVLVYNMKDVSDIYHRFGGVQGSLYVIGGVSVQLQKYGDVTLAVIRSGVGLRVGANVGYLKYTRAPTWNPL